jgi:Homeodomain-like domain
MSKQFVVRLTPEERTELGALLRRDAPSGFTLRRARILLHADAGGASPYRTDAEIAAAVGVEARTVARVRAQYATEGLAATLERRPRPEAAVRRRLDAAGEARLVALACSAPPPGQARWSLRLLAHRLVELEVVPHFAPETVRATLQKTRSSRGA